MATDIPLLNARLDQKWAEHPLSPLLFQALWRGYQVRKALRLAAVLPLWESLDEAYRLCVLCQNTAIILHCADKSWDATESPWYVWMLTQGRYLEALEEYMLKRGWARPPEKPLQQRKAAAATDEVMRLYRRGRYAPRPPSWSYLC